jgi:alpha-L-arabinofuranosidase
MKLYQIFFLSVVLLSAKVPAEEKAIIAKVTVDTEQIVRDVPPLWLGQNVEWVWKGQGLFNEDGSGAKPGVVELIKPLKVGLIRYPGGSLANTFRWVDSIGPLGKRKAVTNFFEKKGEVPLLGFDDFMKFVQQVEAKGAILIVNCDLWPKKPENSGTAQEATAWVAYANAKVGDRPVAIGEDERKIDWKDSQYWANLRASNGHPEPYNIKYWEIGNEIYASDQGAGLTPETYVARVIEFSRLMKQVDPCIRIGVIDWGQGAWKKVHEMITREPGIADFRITHDYVNGGKGLFQYNTGFRDTGDREYAFTSQAGKHSVTVIAWSRQLRGVGPIMKVELDGTELGTANVKAVSDEKGEVTDTFTFERELKEGKHTLVLRFLNPEPVEGGPYRDLYLKSISIQPDGGAQQIIDTNNLELLMIKNAGCTEKLTPLPVPDAKPKPGLLPYHRTEYGCINPENNYGLCNDQKSAVFSARIAQASLIDPNCEGANYWCIKSGSFRILETDPDGHFRYAPAGIVFRTLAPLAEGQVVMTSYDGPNLMASWIGLNRKCGLVAAVAVKKEGKLAVNLLSYHPTSPIAVTLKINGVAIKQGKARTISMVGPGPEAMNAEGRPPIITMQEETVEAGQETTIIIQPCSVVTLVLDTANPDQ